MRLQDKIMDEQPSRYMFGRGSVSQEDVEGAANADADEAGENAAA